jgi:tetratricopeptide (TPR) repeat protein
MPRVPNLTLVDELPGLSQKMMGGALATNWSRSDAPPLGADKVGYYAAAFNSGLLNGQARSRLARCILWCDCDLGRYNPHHLPAYRESAAAFPDDERSQFFMGALLYHKVVSDSELAAKVYPRILGTPWRVSKYWRVYEVPDKAVLMDLAKLFCEEPGNIEQERVAIVEMALAKCEGESKHSPLRQAMSLYLGSAYRRLKRTDPVAEEVYRFLFNLHADDEENNTFLAEMLAARNAREANACAVYARQAAHLEMRGNKEEANQWIVNLARAYIALGRVDEGSRAILGRAAKVEPDDRDIAAAHLYVSALTYGKVDPAFVEVLEEAMVREEEMAARFAKQRWEWAVVVRALAVSYGAMARTDETSRNLYARAAKMNPGDRELLGYHARSLAMAKDYSEEALLIYEKSLGIVSSNGEGLPLEQARGRAASVTSDNVVGTALAQAYVDNNAFAGTRRPQALALWETLYRQGKATEPMVEGLVQAYTGEDRINDVALSLWERVIENQPNNGELRLRLAQEWKQRNDMDMAARYYKAAAKLMPKNFTAQYECAMLLKESFSDFTGALRMLQKAVKLPEGRRHLEAHFALGDTLMARGKREEAREVFLRITQEIDANHTETLLLLAQLSLKYEEQSVKQAEALYVQAKTLSPEHPETYRRMADLYHEKGQHDQEQEALEKYLALSEPDAQKYKQLADLYIRRGDFLRAESALRQVIALGQDDKKLYTLLGEVILQGRNQAA